MIRFSLALVAACVLADAASAESFSPKTTEVCNAVAGSPGALRLDRRRVVGVLLKGIDDYSIDPSGVEVGFDEKIAGILDPVGFCDMRKCAKGISQKFGLAFGDLDEFLQSHSTPVAPGKAGYQVFAVEGGPVDIRAFLSGSETRFTALCVAGPKTAEPKQPATPVTGLSQHLVVRKSPDDLRVLQGGDSFKALQRAKATFTRDFEGNGASFSFDGVVGYAFGQGVLAPGVFGQVIPFLGYTQQYIEKNGVGVNKIFNISAGVTGNILFPALGMYNDVQFFPKYVYSPDSGAQIFSANLTYTPEPDIPLIGVAMPLFGNALWAQINPQLKLAYSNVIDDAGNPALATKDYLRFGGRLGLTVAGDEWLKGFSFNTSYEAYLTTDPTMKSIDRFEAAFAYALPDKQLWALELSYVKGRNLDTLQRQDEVTLGLGLKY